jgi:hypothetical protein
MRQRSGVAGPVGRYLAAGAPTEGAALPLVLPNTTY